MNSSDLHKARRSNLFVMLLFAVVSFLYCFPLLKDLYSSCRGDWDYFLSLYEAQSISLLEYRQFPLWNPYLGGGMPLAANPQVGLFAPTTLFTILFGAIAGFKLSIWFHTFLGMWGMWLLSGHWGMKSMARFAPSLIFMMSSSWALHLAEGHIVWLPAAFLPFWFLFYLKGIQDSRWLVAAAFIESMMFYEGATYVFTFALLFMSVYSSFHSLEVKKLRPFGVFIVMNLIAVMLSAPKFLPMIELMHTNPRLTDAGASVDWKTYLSFFVDRRQTLNRRLSGAGWWEFGSYVGIWVVILYCASLSLYRKHRAIIIASLFMLLLTMGNFAMVSPWKLLHQVPFLSNLKVPTRASIVLVFSAAILVGLYLEAISNSVGRYCAMFVRVVVIFIGIDLFFANFSIFSEAAKPEAFSSSVWQYYNAKPPNVAPELYKIAPASTTTAWHTIAAFHQPFKQISIPFVARNAHGAWSDQYLSLIRNIGVVDAYETIPFKRNAISTDDKCYKGEFHLTGEGKASLLAWSPNKLVFNVKIDEPNRLIINQNNWSGWHASKGVISEDKGLLAIDLMAGEYDLTVSYGPRSFEAGIIMLVAGVIGSILIVLRNKTAANLF